MITLITLVLNTKRTLFVLQRGEICKVPVLIASLCFLIKTAIWGVLSCTKGWWTENLTWRVTRVVLIYGVLTSVQVLVSGHRQFIAEKKRKKLPEFYSFRKNKNISLSFRLSAFEWNKKWADEITIDSDNKQSCLSRAHRTVQLPLTRYSTHFQCNKFLFAEFLQSVPQYQSFYGSQLSSVTILQKKVPKKQENVENNLMKRITDIMRGDSRTSQLVSPLHFASSRIQSRQVLTVITRDKKMFSQHPIIYFFIEITGFSSFGFTVWLFNVWKSTQ